MHWALLLNFLPLAVLFVSACLGFSLIAFPLSLSIYSRRAVAAVIKVYEEFQPGITLFAAVACLPC